MLMLIYASCRQYVGTLNTTRFKSGCSMDPRFLFTRQWIPWPRMVECLKFQLSPDILVQFCQNPGFLPNEGCSTRPPSPSRPPQTPWLTPSVSGDLIRQVCLFLRSLLGHYPFPLAAWLTGFQINITIKGKPSSPSLARVIQSWPQQAQCPKTTIMVSQHSAAPERWPL